MEPGFIVSVDCFDAAALAGWLKGAPSVENFIGETTDLEVATQRFRGGGADPQSFLSLFSGAFPSSVSSAKEGRHASGFRSLGGHTSRYT